MRGQWRLVTISSVLYAGHQGTEALVPVLIGVVIDDAVATGSGGALLRWIGVLAAVFLVLSMCFRFGARTGERASYQAGHALRLQLTERVLDHRGGAEANRLSGALVNIATDDAKRVGAVNLALPIGIAALSGLVVGGVVLLSMSLTLGLLVLLGIPLLLWAAHLLGKPLERRSHAEQERAAHASGVATDLVGGLRVLKGIGAAPAAIARYRRTSQNSLAATLRAARAEAWHDGAMLVLTGLVVAVIALVGGRLAAQGEISVGNLVAAVGLAQFLLGPLTIFAWVNGQLAQGRASAARIASVLAAPYSVPPGTAALPESVAGRLRLHAVSHAALRQVDVDVAPGELIGVVSTDPGAATALLECLGRETDPATGSLSLDGVPLDTLNPDELRTAVLVAAHDADLFEESLIDNVRAGRDGDVRPALSAAAADEVAETLPDGVRTVLAERGRSLSGGQRQRAALARALAANPPVLVVHDPTTAVDAMTEARIAAGIRATRDGRTTVLVTTSPALLAVTDRVVLLDGGAISAEGEHADLVHGNERYRTTVLA
ncbi:MAG: ATP-binding cassette domain-containing protein [Pseudonocardiaceae bacterium]|nr:ATP-binding cassette domain-containing protein [Pseudonocardiaceae bacterium]